MFKHFITPEGQACVYMLRDSKLTNVSLEHRGENKTNSSLSFGKIWQMSKAKWCHFFELRGRVGAEQELQISVATTALQFCSCPGRHGIWVKRWANSLMSITRARVGISSWKYTNACVSFFKKVFPAFPECSLCHTGKPVRACQIILVGKPPKIQIALRAQRIRLLVVCEFIGNISCN